MHGVDTLLGMDVSIPQMSFPSVPPLLYRYPPRQPNCQHLCLGFATLNDLKFVEYTIVRHGFQSIKVTVGASSRMVRCWGGETQVHVDNGRTKTNGKEC